MSAKTIVRGRGALTTILVSAIVAMSACGRGRGYEVDVGNAIGVDAAAGIDAAACTVSLCQGTGAETGGVHPGGADSTSASARDSEGAHTDSSDGEVPLAQEGGVSSAMASCGELDCKEMHRLCESEPTPHCTEDCVAGYVWDAVLAGCRKPKSCSDIQCGNGQTCVLQTSSADAYCSGAVCAKGQGLDTVTQACRPCLGDFSPVCDGEGETGNVLLQDSQDNATCFCETKEGYYYSGSQGKRAERCDVDGDGWVNDNAQPVIEGANAALRENARCDVRRVSAIYLEAESGEALKAISFAGQFGNPSIGQPDGLPLYESSRNDGSSTSDVPPYPGRALAANELNSLTKACASSTSPDAEDYNHNGVSDVDEWSGAPPELGERHPKSKDLPTYYEQYTRFAYFVELHKGWFVPTDSDNPGGSYRIAEKTRKELPGPQDVPIRYLDGTDPYAYQCRRHVDTQYTWESDADGLVNLTSDNTIGADFAEFEVDSWAMTHHSQFKCVRIVDPVKYEAQTKGSSSPSSRLPQLTSWSAGKLYRNSSSQTLGWTTNTCRAADGAASPGTGLKSEGAFPNIECQADAEAPSKESVRWAAVGFENELTDPIHASPYVSRLSPGYYTRGCVNECAEEPLRSGVDRCKACGFDPQDGGAFGKGNAGFDELRGASCTNDYGGVSVCDGTGGCESCVPGYTDCDALTYRICDSSGLWQAQGFVVNACGVECTNPGGQVECIGTHVWMCDSNYKKYDAGVSFACPATQCTEPQSGCTKCGDGTRACNDGIWGACTGGTYETTYYADADGDGYCVQSQSTLACPRDQPPGTRESSQCYDCPYYCYFKEDCTDNYPNNSNVCSRSSDLNKSYTCSGILCAGNKCDWSEDYATCPDGYHIASCYVQNGSDCSCSATADAPGEQSSRVFVHLGVAWCDSETITVRCTCNIDGT